jgi:hypothetical protein
MGSPVPFVLPQYFGNTAAFLSAGTLDFYAAGTVVRKNTYSDIALTTPNANPVVLDSTGRKRIYLEEGSYYIVLKDSLGNTIWSEDNVPGSTGSGVASYQTVESIADLKALASGSSSYVLVGGYYANGDGGGGLFYWDSVNTSADNAGTIFLPNSTPATGRWVRLYSGAVNIRWFGAVGDAVTDDYTAIFKANAYVQTLALGGNLFFPASSGAYLFQTNLVFGTKVVVTREKGAMLTSAGLLITFSTKIELGNTQFFSSTVGLITFKGAGPILPEWWGATGDGTTDDTAAIQACVASTEVLGGEISFDGHGIYVLKMVFITIGKLKLQGNGCTLIQNHDPVNSIDTSGSGLGYYKCSNAFFIKRGAVDVEITQFIFTTGAAFPASAFTAGYGSYFASIAGQHFDRLYIHNNKFLGANFRALFTQAGKNIRLEDNYVENCGLTIHIGYLLNSLLYDSSTDISIKYSPENVSVSRNTFNGYSTLYLTTCLFLTGAIRITVKDNKLYNMNEATALRPLIIYSNDYGPFDSTGAALSYIEGEVSGNQISGTFLAGLEINGHSVASVATWDNSYRMRIAVHDNVVRGTGIGIKLDRVRGTIVQDNYVTVTGSALYLSSFMDDVRVEGNTFETTSAGTNQQTIYSLWSAGATDWVFSRNRVITPTGDQYAINASANLIGLVMEDNVFEFNSTVASCRMVILKLGGDSRIKGNRVYFNSSVTGVSLFVLDGNTNLGRMTLADNILISSAGAGAASLRFCSVATFLSIIAVGNICGALVLEDTDTIIVKDNILILPSSNTASGITCDNSGYAAKAYVQCHNNRVLMPAALNVPCIEIISNNDGTNNTKSKVFCNFVEGNSSGVLIRQTVQGLIQAFENAIVNNGAGGVLVGVTASAVLLVDFQSAVTMPLTLGVTGLLTAIGGIQITGGNELVGGINKSATAGLLIAGVTGSTNDITVDDPAGGTVFKVPTGTKDVIGNGKIQSTAPDKGVGYATGAGGTVTQATSKATAVTLSKVSGEIVTHNALLAAGAVVSFTWTNTTIAAADGLVLANKAGGTAGAYHFDYQCAAGSAVITIRNLTAGGLSEAITIGFQVVKGVTS